MMIHLAINPEPWAIGTAYAYRGGKGAGISPNVKLATFKQAVAEMIQDEYQPAMLPPEAKVCLRFWFCRNTREVHTTTKTIRPKIADATNLQKGLEDALQGTLFPNDQQVLDITSKIVAQGPDVEPGIVIEIIPAEDEEKILREYQMNKLIALSTKPKVEKLDNNRW